MHCAVILVKMFTKIASKYLYYVTLFITLLWGDSHGKVIERLRGLREDSDKTQEEIAKVLGTSQTMYARYERGANELPLRHFIALCKYYNVSSDVLLGLRKK